MYLENGLANHAAACAYGFLLSMAPMLLLIALFLLIFFKPSPESITALIGNIPFLENTFFDEKWLSGDFLSFTAPGIPGIVFVVSIIWAGRLLAISMQRGIKVIFKTEKHRNPVKDNLITFTIESLVIILVLVAIVSSRLAFSFYRLFDFLPDKTIINFISTYTGNQISFLVLLGVVLFFVYRFVPIRPPRKRSAFTGALFCIVAYLGMAMIIGLILNIARYNFLYGAMGNLIVILVNVYFFFVFFFVGAQLVFVMDSFDALLFKKLRSARRKEWLFRLYYPSGGDLKKYLHKYEEGRIILHRGDHIEGVFYLLEGEIEIIGGNIDILKPGSFFGDVGHLLKEDKSDIVRAKTDVTVFLFPLPFFNSILKYDTHLDRVLLEDMSRIRKKRK
jgi:membrane protein